MEACVKYRWLALRGDQQNTFAWHPKGRGVEWRYYSPFRNVRTPSGGIAKEVRWGNTPVKKMLERFRDGKRERFEVPADVSEDYKISMFSECEKDVMSKKTKRLERRFVRIGSRPNHKWDCECEGLVMAQCFYVLHERAEAKGDVTEEVAPPVSTGG